MNWRKLLFGIDPPTQNYFQTAFADPSTLIIRGTTTTDQSALALPTFYRGVQILHDLAGQLPWQAMRGGIHSDAASLAPPEVLDPQPMVIVKPSPFHTRAEVIRRIVRHLIIRGNAFLWLTGHDTAGFPTMAVPINPDEVTVQWVDARTSLVKRYMWREQVMHEGVDILHISMEPLLGSPIGLGPLQAAMLTLGFIADAEKFGGDFFGGSATPAGTLMHPGRLDKEEADKLRVQWEEQHAGGRGTAVLAGGIEYRPVSLTPEQAQFIATRAFGNQQIATLLGLPQHLLNAGQPQGTASSLTYANLAMVISELHRLTLDPVYLSRIEDAFRRILPRGQSVRFITTELLRTDDAMRWGAYEVALRNNILSHTEVRQLEGRQPLPNDGKDPQAEAATQALIDREEDEQEEEPSPNGAIRSSASAE